MSKIFTFKNVKGLQKEVKDNGHVIYTYQGKVIPESRANELVHASLNATSNKQSTESNRSASSTRSQSAARSPKRSSDPGDLMGMGGASSL